MSAPVPGGLYRLKKGTRLITEEGRCFALQMDPLRAIGVNPSAMRILEQCRGGFSPWEEGDDTRVGAAVSLCDTLYVAGILDWVPSRVLFEPFVSVIVPVYNRAHEIGPCLESLLCLNYPVSRREIIVVDDASTDQTVSVVRGYDVRLLIQSRNLGQSAARNAGVRAAKGEIIAFMDSDCTADPRWLDELLPYFHDPRPALVGGYVDDVGGVSRLDRFEAVQSPLNMGAGEILGKGDKSVFYVPTCNMLVRKALYLQTGGLDEQLRVGEDVDFCWKLMSEGHRLLYIPKGRVNHRHRNRFPGTFSRRFDYGTSEAVLYDMYPQKTKRFPVYREGILLLLLLLTALTIKSVALLLGGLVFLMVETLYKQMRFNRSFGLALPLRRFFSAIGKRHLMLSYHLTYHVTRYYLIPAIVLAFFVPQTALPLLVVSILPAVVLYFEKKPDLGFPFFFLFFCLAQGFYQSGVFWGCLKQGSFRLYRVSFDRPNKTRSAKGGFPHVARRPYG